MNANERQEEIRCCKACRFYAPQSTPAACTALGYPVPWSVMIETDCRGINSPLWQPIEVTHDEQK